MVAEADDQHRRPREAVDVAAEGVAEAAQEAERQGAAGVGALFGEAVVAADQAGEDRLRAPLAAAARDEVPEAGALGRDEVVDRGLGVVDDLAAGVALADPDREVGLLGAGRDLPDPAQLVAEAAGVEQRLAAEGHVGADQVADRLALARHPRVGAADDPVELGREPARSPASPSSGARCRRRRARSGSA